MAAMEVLPVIALDIVPIAYSLEAVTEVTEAMEDRETQSKTVKITSMT